MKTIKIFLASSEELKQERLELADLVENLNQRLSALGLQIQLVKWEYLDASMGPKHKQEEYNEALRECEMCLVLYWTRFGDYTTIELDTAYQELCAGHNPKKLYVYFKDGTEPSPELQAFMDSFPTRYGHFYSHFQNADTLKAEFLLQFIDYQKNYLQSSSLVEVKDGQVCIGGKVYVDLKNVPFAGNNEEYNLLMKDIKKTQKLLSVTEPDDPDYREYAIELNELKERQKQMENSLWDTALMITQLSTTQCSERLKRAMDLFSQGDNKGALAVLNEEEIDRDISHNLQLIQLGEEGKKGLAINIDEMLLKIKALETERKDGWFEEVDRLYSRCIEIGKGNLTEQKLFEVLLDYAIFLLNQNQFAKAETIIKEALYKDLHFDSQGALLLLSMLDRLAFLYSKTQRINESIDTCEKILDLYKHLAIVNPQAYKSEVARTLNNLAILYSDIHQPKESEKRFVEALEIYRCLYSDDQPKYEKDIAITLNNLANLYSKTQQIEKSEASYLEAIEIYRRLADSNPLVYEPNVAMALNNLANLYSTTQRFNDSEKLFKKALEILKRLAISNPQAYKPNVAMTLNNLAILYLDTQRFEESKAMHLDALESFRHLAEDNPLVYEPDLAMMLNNLAYMYFKTQQLDESEASFLEAMEILRRLAEEKPSLYKTQLAQTLGRFAHLKNIMKQFSKAERMSMEGLRIDPKQIFIYTNLAAALLLQGKYEEAEAIYLKYKDELQKLFLDDFEQFEEAGIIPEECKSDVERIKKLLMEE